MTDNDFKQTTLRYALAGAVAGTMILLGILLGILPGILSAPAVAQQMPDLTPQSAEAREYSACMRLAKARPAEARQSALAWRTRGGGNPALHCVAVALLGLGQYSQSAHMMEELAANSAPDRPDLRAGLLAQAANGWIIAGRPQTAAKLLGDALVLQPVNIDFMIDRSIAFASLGKYWDALDDLNRAVERAPDRIDALTFRASAWRRVEALDLARQDIDAVLIARPDNPDALLERGLIHKALGDRDAARADWLKVLEIAIEGPLTEAARRNIEQMDVLKR